MGKTPQQLKQPGAKAEAKTAAQRQADAAQSPRIDNRRAHHDYLIFDKVEAGIALLGSEVKSVRLGRVQLAGAFAIIRNGQIYLVGAHIEEYEKANQFNHDPTRTRPLLLHRREIRKLEQRMAKEQGSTLIPLEFHFKRGYVKVVLAVAKGKSKFDKRQALKERDAKRDMQRALHRR